MHQRTTITSDDDVSVVTDRLTQSPKFDDQLSFTNTEIRSVVKEEEQQTRLIINEKILHGIRAKSTDYSRPRSTMASSSLLSSTRSSVTDIAKHYRTKNENERHGLITLNDRFANYLDKIKSLADVNIDLRRRIDDMYQTYMKHHDEQKTTDKKNYGPSEMELHKLRRQLNKESRQLSALQTCLQRAQHDKKYYRNKLTLFSTSEQYQSIKQKLDGDIYELDLLKEQYEKRHNDLQLSKMQYHEYITKLNDYTNEYNQITYERMQIEHGLYTLKEQILFEQEYNQRCLQEFESLDKIQHDSNNHFNKTEFENTLQKIREDYQQYHQSQLSELESLYKSKLNSIQQIFHTDEKDNSLEEVKQLTEQNRSLQQKLKQLEYDLHHIIEQNQQQYEVCNQEYHQYEVQLPELESLLLYSRENTIQLSSEINTYRCLLINLVPSSQTKTKPPLSLPQISGFVVHFEDGIIWVRI